MNNEPFELGSGDYTDDESERLSNVPLTVGQRLTAMELRQLDQSKDIKMIKHTLVSLVPEVNRMKAMTRWGSIGLKTIPVLLTALAAQFPQFKSFILAVMNAVTVAQ